MDVVTMSSKGQIVIPRSIREELSLGKSDKFMIVADRDDILLKRIKQSDVKKQLIRLADKYSAEFRRAGITRQDLEREIADARKA
jgi:AbrB family looped-hinge helix DNA binding protein